jgi:hypothetical protein
MEAKTLAKAASGRGQLVGEWAREALLNAAQGQRKQDESMAGFIELQAIRLLLINTLEPLLRGEQMSPEQFKAMLQYVKANKRKVAADALASYAEGGASSL